MSTTGTIVNSVEDGAEFVADLVKKGNRCLLTIFPAHHLTTSPLDRRLTTEDISAELWYHFPSPPLTSLAVRTQGGQLEQRSKIGLCGLFMVQVSKHLKLFIGLRHLLFLFIIIVNLQERIVTDSSYCNIISLFNSWFLLKFPILKPARPTKNFDWYKWRQKMSFI